MLTAFYLLGVFKMLIICSILQNKSVFDVHIIRK